jgi:hypothetical protein
MGPTDGRDFTLGGRRMRLSRSEVERALRHVEPEAIRSHAVKVNGTLYPMKQAFARATGIDVADFTTHQARRQLKALGFPVSRVA